MTPTHHHAATYPRDEPTRRIFLQKAVDDFHTARASCSQPYRTQLRARTVAACPSTPDAAQRGFRARPLPTFIQIRRAPAEAMSATPPMAVWITRLTTPLVVLAPSWVTSGTPPRAEWLTLPHWARIELE